MAPVGTVTSIGPSVNRGNDRRSPRISSAFGDMLPCPFRVDERAQKSYDVVRAQSRFGAFAECGAQQIHGALRLALAAACSRGVGDERAQPLAAVDDAVALELLVGALDGDDADEQLFGETAERRERGAGRQAPFADLALDAVDDLLIQRARRSGRNGRNDQPWQRGAGHALLYILNIDIMSSR